MRKSFYIGMVVIGVLLILFPQTDLYVSSLFYDGGFYLKKDPFLVFWYKSVNFMVFAMSITVLGSLVYLTAAKKEFKMFPKRSLLYLLIVFGVGSGLIVNAFLKENVGRARPSHIVQFGGDKTFSKPMEITDQCKSNGSFTCGHCSFAFGFLAFYFLFRKNWILILAAGYGLVVSATRIMQGGHFLSDAYFSFVVMFMTADLTYRYWFNKERMLDNDTSNN